MAPLAGTAPKTITQTPLIIGDLRSPLSDANAPEVKFVERRLGYMQFLASTEQIERIDFLYAELPESNRHRGSGHPLSPATPPYMRVRIRRFSELSPRGPELRVVVRHKGFATLQVSVSASPSSEPVKLSRS